MPENYLLSFLLTGLNIFHIREKKKKDGGGNPILFIEPLCQQFSNEILQKV